MEVLVNGVSSPRIGGTPTILRALIGSLGKVAPEMSIRLFVSPATLPVLGHLATHNIEVVPVKGVERSIMHRLWFEQARLPRFGRNGGGPVLLSPANLCSFRWPGPQVMIVQSIAPFLRDAQRGKGAWQKIRYPVLNTLTRLSFRVADIVVANSALTQALLLERGCPAEKLRIIPLGRSEDFSQAAPGPPSDGPPNGQYLLTVGLIARHKNLEVLIQALGILRRQGCEWPLKIVGPWPDQKYLDFLRETVSSLEIGDLVTFAGPLPYEQLPDIYRGAGCYVLPSLVENFPHTLVEAMGVGCPIASARQIPTAEICGPAALEFDALDAADVARIIRKMMTDAPLRDRLREDGLRRAESFDWLALAREYVTLFREVSEVRRRDAA